MGRYLGETPISGLAVNKICNANNLFDFKWADHKLNNIEWLRADTFSWQSGSVYVTAYNHLVSDIQGITPVTESGMTVYVADDGHKIVFAEDEQTVLDLYNTTDVAWYYILDTDNTRFKLPRTKYGFVGLRDEVGNFIPESLPNIKGGFYVRDTFVVETGAFYRNDSKTVGGYYGATNAPATGGMMFDASHSSSTYQDGANVQQKSTQMYLYFFVGNYAQTAIEQTAGITTEQLNEKVDIASLTETDVIIDKYVNGTEGYRIWSDGYCEQWGRYAPSSDPSTIYLLKSYKDTNFNVQLAVSDTSPGDWAITVASWNTLTTSTVQVYQGYNGSSQTMPMMWIVRGYLAEGEY